MKYLVLLLFLTSNYSFTSNFTSKDDEGVPPDLGLKETTLLIMKLDKMKPQNGKIQAIFSKYYKGKFIMIESLDEKYDDIENYKYLLTPRAVFNPASGMGATRMPANWSYTANIIDREDKKLFSVGYEGGAYGPFFKAYAKRLEKTRAKNASV